ncbi:ABC transporter ATP-binding protein [Phenylobacterium sp. LjRoot225]|uniref:ABC transporter ATP-binding protein n=1 Tax=Phenylobacterium sp. LjRoot225 TaxID=3342285 RepID=UPI003ED0D29A
MAQPLIRPAAPQTSPVGDTAVRVRNFTRRFGAVTVLEGLDIEIRRGEFVALLGRSGSGKTTLLRTLAGLDPTDGQDVAAPPARAVVFQDARLLPWKKVWRNVALGLSGSDVRARAEAALREVELDHRADAWPSTLSGGESQRASLARALVREPGLLLLDEPFAAIDALTRLRMHDLVLSLWRRHAPTVLMVTHDVDEAIALADRVLVLENGRISAEERIELDRPRAIDHRFQAIRSRLLGKLGVVQPIPEPPPAHEGALLAFPTGEVVA